MDGKLRPRSKPGRQSAGRTQSATLVRSPSWSGLTPALPRADVLDEQSATHILGMIGLEPAQISEVSALLFGDAPSHMYRVDATAGQSFLLKLVDVERQEGVLRAEGVAAWLAEQGLDFPAPLPGFPRETPEGDVAILLPFMSGRRVEASISDMRALGQALGAFHHNLVRHPDLGSWRDFTDDRLSELNAVRERLVKKHGARPQYADRLSELAADRSLDFRFDALPRRPLHGDMNPGNILIAGDKAVLMDFEDVFHSVLPIAFDLALVLERLVLVRVGEEQLAIDLGRAFMFEYSRSGESFVDVAALSAQEWTSVLRSLALRSLCTLALGEESGIQVETVEWEKFFYLEQLATGKGHLIECMAREIENL